jgi:hypothetical protein
MLLRLFWPCGTLNTDLDQTHPCLLLGALSRSTQQSQAVVNLLVVSILPVRPLPDAEEVQQHLASCSVTLPGVPTPAALGVLGIWQPEPLGTPKCDCAQRKQPFPRQNDVWLVLKGRQQLWQALGSGSKKLGCTSAPVLSTQHSSLPTGTRSIQVRVHMGLAVAGDYCCHKTIQPLAPPVKTCVTQC